MRRQTTFTLIISLAIALILSACTSNLKTADWKVFSIEQEPALDIQFRLPPGWLQDYAPSKIKPGQWDITLVPPKCSPDQEEEYQQNCVTLVAHIKGASTFSKDAFYDLTSGDIPLSQDGTQSAMLLGQDSLRVNGLDIDQFNHLISTALGEVKMSTYFFETESAYFTFITNFPYEEAENEAAQQFDLMLESVEEID